MRYVAPVLFTLGAVLVLIGQCGPVLEARLRRTERERTPDAADLIVARTKGSDCAKVRAEQFILAKLPCNLWPSADDCADWPKAYDNGVLQQVYCRAAVESWKVSREKTCAKFAGFKAGSDK